MNVTTQWFSHTTTLQTDRRSINVISVFCFETLITYGDSLTHAAGKTVNSIQKLYVKVKFYLKR